MAGPLSGIGGQTQVPQATQTQSSSQNNQGVRQQDDQRGARPNEIQAPEAPVNETQTSNGNNLNAAPEVDFFAANTNETEVDPNAPRGSIIDIAV